MGWPFLFKLYLGANKWNNEENDQSPTKRVLLVAANALIKSALSGKPASTE